jgi:hypothetical protein
MDSSVNVPSSVKAATDPKVLILGGLVGLPDDLLVIHCHVDLLNRAVPAFGTDSGLPPGR